MARRQGRELAFRTLFQAGRSQTSLLETWQSVRDDLLENVDKDEDDTLELDSEAVALADKLISTYSEHQKTIDETLQDSVEGWTFSQMAQTDLNVLRLAMTELLYDENVPDKVTLEMAVRLAKKYGGEESGKFVNGVLGRFVRSQQSGKKVES
jgi:transcription antitermination protein NusB